jgi:hypothetical protein
MKYENVYVKRSHRSKKHNFNCSKNTDKNHNYNKKKLKKNQPNNIKNNMILPDMTKVKQKKIEIVNNLNCSHCKWILCETSLDILSYIIVDKRNNYGIVLKAAPYAYTISVLTNWHTNSDADISLMMSGVNEYINNFLIPNGFTNFRILINRAINRYYKAKEHLHMFIIMNSNDSKLKFDNYFNTKNGIWSHKYLRAKPLPLKPYIHDSTIIFKCDNMDYLLFFNQLFKEEFSVYKIYDAAIKNEITCSNNNSEHVFYDNMAFFIFATYKGKDVINAVISLGINE